MAGEATHNQAELLAQVDYGARLQELIGTPGNDQIAVIAKNREDIIRMLNELRVFSESMLRPYHADAQESVRVGAVIAHYSKENEQVYVFLTTDANPKVVSSVLNSLPEELRGVKKEFVFLGYQDPELSKTEMNRKSELRSCQKAGIMLPLLYRQVYDLLINVQSSGVEVPHIETLSRLLTHRQPRSNSLLIGNGLNLLRNTNMGWTKILRQLATDFIAPAEQTAAYSFVEDGAIPSPIKFEYLANHSANRLSGTNIFGRLKDGIADILTGHPTGINLPPDDIQSLLRRADISNLLTTNYDQVLEHCFGLSVRPITESKYILSPTSHAGETPRVYHVHGISAQSRNSTICIGYEHYMGYIQKLRTRLIRDRRRRESVLNIVFLLLRIVPPSSTWEELFFTTNMSIVGLGLAFEETDLWELLVLRSAVLNTSNTLRSFGLPKESCANTITYYAVEVPDDPSRDGDKTDDYVAHANRIRGLSAPIMDGEYWLPVPENKAKEKALTGLNVEVKVVHATSYEAGYRTILEALPT